jgi:putative membrane protein
MKVKEISEKDLERIKEAVRQAEGSTSGEIVPYLVKKSDDYEEIRFKSAILFILAPLFILAILSYAWILPFHITILEMVLTILGMGVIGYFLPEVLPAFKRLLISDRRLQDTVERRALTAFLEQEVFSTENRTGILIFISRFEHMVEVIGDKGINEKVNPSEWHEVVDIIVKGIREKDPVGGIIHGIEKCGKLLAAAGVHKPPDNPNELSDNLRME